MCFSELWTPISKFSFIFYRYYFRIIITATPGLNTSAFFFPFRGLMNMTEFDSSYVGFTQDGAQYLVDNTDIKLVGKIINLFSVFPIFFTIFYSRFFINQTKQFSVYFACHFTCHLLWPINFHFMKISLCSFALINCSSGS